jgi:FKBP-type peptidyl-prolyl cis-trans isomerase
LRSGALQGCHFEYARGVLTQKPIHKLVTEIADAVEENDGVLHFLSIQHNLISHKHYLHLKGSFTMQQKFAVILKFLVGGLCLSLIACDKPDLKQPKGQYSYAIGVQIAKNMKEQHIDLDSKAFAAAVNDVAAGKNLQMTDEERMQALRTMSEGLRAKDSAVADENLKKGQAFLEDNKKKEGVKETKSGLQYKMVRDGKGNAPKATDTVEVNYAGKLIDGKEFDSSYARKQPAQFPVKGVIPGWTEALQLMKPGSEYELVIPPNLAYGERGNPSIPPNSVLVFKVELLKVVK